MPFAAAAAAATVDLPAAVGMTRISNAGCMVFLTVPTDQTLQISNGDSVRLPINGTADDNRTTGRTLHSYFLIEAAHQSTMYANAAYIATDPGQYLADTFYLTVPNVQENTTMEVLYIVYVWNPDTMRIQCYADSGNETTTFTFV